MILREHSDTYLRTIRIRSCNEIFNFNKKSSQIFVIMYAHFTTELRALFLPEITYLLRKSQQGFSEQLLLFFGRHWGRNLCSENTFLQKTGNEDNYDVHYVERVHICEMESAVLRQLIEQEAREMQCKQPIPSLPQGLFWLLTITTPGGLVPWRRPWYWN